MAVERGLTGAFICGSVLPWQNGRMKKHLALAALTLALLAPLAVAGERDHDRARRAVEAGEIRPLREILATAEQAHGGQLIEAELETEDGKLVYELKILVPGDRVLKVYYDARTGESLGTGKPNRHR